MLCEMMTNADRWYMMINAPTQTKGCRNTLDDRILIDSLNELVERVKFLALIISSSSVSKEKYVVPLIFLNEDLENYHKGSCLCYTVTMKECIRFHLLCFFGFVVLNKPIGGFRCKQKQKGGQK